MLKIVNVFRVGGRLSAFVDTSELEEKLYVGNVLVDDAGNAFLLTGVGFIRYASVAALEERRHQIPIVLRPLDGLDVEPIGTLRLRPSSTG